MSAGSAAMVAESRAECDRGADRLMPRIRKSPAPPHPLTLGPERTELEESVQSAMQKHVLPLFDGSCGRTAAARTQSWDFSLGVAGCYSPSFP